MALRAIVAPSMLSSDFARLAEEAARMASCGADWLHMDVMDGHFVPNLTLGAPIVRALRRHTKLFLDCHLMVSEPERWVDDFAAAGASQLVFHYEATRDAAALARRVRAAGMRAGIALKPATPVTDAVLTVLRDADLVLVMTVEPGFGGQRYMPECADKCTQLRKALPTIDIQVDGGLAPDTVAHAASRGANVIVAGSAVFGAKDPAAVVSQLRAAVTTALET